MTSSTVRVQYLVDEACHLESGDPRFDALLDGAAELLVSQIDRHELVERSWSLPLILSLSEEPNQKVDAVFMLGRKFWEQVSLMDPSPQTMARAIRWGVKVEDRAGSTAVEKLANRLAWLTRGFAGGFPEVEDLELGSKREQELFARIYLDRCRFVFDAPALRSAVGRIRSLLPEIGNDPYVVANLGFSQLVNGSVSEGLKNVRKAWDRANENPAVVDVCLHALWMNDDSEESAIQLDTWCEDLESRGAMTDISYYRHAAALRRLNRYDEALGRINEAFRAMRGRGSFFELFNEQCVREREIILNSANLTRRENEILETIEQTKAELHEARTEGRRNLISTIEILGVFTAAISFFLGTLSVGVEVDSVAIAVVLIVGMAISLLMFVSALHLIIRSHLKGLVGRS